VPVSQVDFALHAHEVLLAIQFQLLDFELGCFQVEFRRQVVDLRFKDGQ